MRRNMIMNEFLHEIGDFIDLYVDNELYEAKIVSRYRKNDDFIYIVRYRKPGKRKYIGSAEISEKDL